MNRPLNNPGFTLIELLVAMAMMTLIVSMVYGSYAATSQSLDIYSSRLACSQRTGLVLRLITRQICCAYRPPTEPNMAESSDVDRHRAVIKTAPPVFHGNAEDPQGELLSFVTTAGLGTEPGAQRGLSRVRYRYDTLTRTLSIASHPYVDRLQKKELTGSWQPLLTDVTGVSIEFHDGRKWLRHWNVKRKKELPAAVKIGITTVDEKGRPYYLGATVPILSHVATVTGVSRQQAGSGRL